MRHPCVASTVAEPKQGTARFGTATEIRADIQGLRAVAVSMVLVYHLSPSRLSGGFVGVDVFFVISGFLITSHLLAHPPTRARDLATFWGRRIRRLLPAASVVLLATLLASRIWAPDTQWANTAAQAKAASLYIVNWHLANDSVNYLAAAAAPSPIQHFWSLSVEEQFYFVWPVLILVLVLMASRLRWKLIPTVFAGLAALVLASLAYSIHETAVEPARAYFVTPTRVWELGVGGLLAAALSRRALGRNKDSEAVPLPASGQVLLAWIGFAAIAWSGVSYSGATAFPGWRALVPVLGSAAVLAACAPMSALSSTRILALKPIQWLGDISYSVYLWHWPLIVILPEATGHPLGTRDKIAIIVVSLTLADLTRRFIENRFRASAWGRPLWKPFLLGAVLMTAVVGCATAQTHEVNDRTAAAQHKLQHAISSHGACFGAAALAAGATTCPAPATNSGTLVPSPLVAATDKSDAYADVSGGKDCFAYLPTFKVVTCTRGDVHASVKVALVGNSHAGQWLSTLEAIAAQRHWQVTTYLASQCAYATTIQHFDTDAHAQACHRWGVNVTQQIVHGGYSLVVMTNRISVTAQGYSLPDSYPVYGAGYEAELKTFSAAHLHVVGIRDTPAPGKSVPDCLAAHPNSYGSCNGSRAKWLPAEPLLAAVKAVRDPNIVSADLTRFICEPTICPAAVGTVPVYFDGSHLTATYAQTLAPYLAPILLGALAA